MVLLALLASGCSVLRCTPATIVVAEARHDDRLEKRVESFYVDPVFGRVREISRDVIVPQYWVRASDGDWIAVDEGTWRRAEQGHALEVCR